MPYEPTIAFIKDTAQIIEQYYLFGRHLRSHLTPITNESSLDRILGHLTNSKLPPDYDPGPRTLTYLLATELLGHSLAPVAFVTGLVYNPK